jgi:hypothetical protein
MHGTVNTKFSKYLVDSQLSSLNGTVHCVRNHSLQILLFKSLYRIHLFIPADIRSGHINSGVGASNY